MSNVIAATVANVQTAGKGARYAEAVAIAVVESTSDTYDWTARGAVPAAILAAIGVDKESAPKQKTGKSGEQVATDFGRGMDAVAKQVRAILAADADDAPKPPVLRVSLSGEGGGSTVVPEDHPLYASLVALLAGDAGEAADAA